MPKHILQQGNKRNDYKSNNEYYIFFTIAFVLLILEHSFIRERNPKDCPFESVYSLETRI